MKEENASSAELPIEDSSPVVNDPLRDIADPKVQLSYERDEDIPSDIKEFLDINGITERSYRSILKRVPEGLGDRARAPYINAWSNTFPTIEYIATEYGPGEYILVFQWRCKEPETQRLKSYGKELTLHIDEHYQDVYEEHQLKKAIARTERQKKIVQQAKLKSDLNASMLGSEVERKPPVDKIEAGKEYLKEIVEAGNMLGLSKRSFDWEKVLAIALPLIPSLFDMITRGRRDESDKIEKIYSMLMMQQSESTKQLIEMVKAQHGPTQGSDVMKEMRDMIFGAIDIKEALAGGKQSLGDKIFDLVQGIAPQVLTIAMKGQQAREVDPMYQMAKNYMQVSPDFQKLRQDPTAQIDLINKLDSFFGYEQTDIILKVGGLDRPAECPHDQTKRFPQGDKRNEISTVPQAEVVEEEKDDE